MSGSEPAGEGRADIVKLRQAIEARLGCFDKLEKRARKCLGSCDAPNPSSYPAPNIGVKPVLEPSRLEIFQKRTQSEITKIKKELGLKLAHFRPGFFDLNFAQKEAFFCLPETNPVGDTEWRETVRSGIAAFRAGILHAPSVPQRVVPVIDFFIGTPSQRLIATGGFWIVSSNGD
ncbi:MAG TPA: hypothetical protein VGZ29_16045 [Terriglobia bacterium]|nr:hypothetical protein [Terriglobia bacterium]